MSDSRATTVTKRIRDDIISGVLTSGTRLTEALLADRYGVSRMPIRESLRALAAEGLVEIRPYAGASVAALPDEDAEDLFAIRIVLEAATARRAAQRARAQFAHGNPDQAWWDIRREISEILNAGDLAVERDDLETLATLNMRFHQAVAELSGSASLVALLGQIAGRIEWLYAINVTRRGSQAWSEHHEIMQAIDAGDVELAAQRMRDHVQRAKDTYAKHVSAP